MTVQGPAVSLGDLFGAVEDPLRSFRPTGDVGVERLRPIDFHDVDADELGIGRLGELADRANEPIVAGMAAQGDYGTPKGGCSGLGHGFLNQGSNAWRRPRSVADDSPFTIPPRAPLVRTRAGRGRPR